MKTKVKKAFYDARDPVRARNKARREMSGIPRLANCHKFAGEDILLNGVNLLQLQGKANFIADAMMEVAPEVIKKSPLDSFLKVTFVAYEEDVAYDIYVAGVVVEEANKNLGTFKVIQITGSNIKIRSHEE